MLSAMIRPASIVIMPGIPKAMEEHFGKPKSKYVGQNPVEDRDQELISC